MFCYSFIVIFVLSILSVIDGEETEIARERMKIIVPAKTESCYFITLQQNNKLSIRFLVISYKDGKQQDITFRVKDAVSNRMVNYQSRKGQGNFTDYEAKNSGDMELCFNNRGSLMDAKTVIWEYDVNGEDDFIIAETEQDQTNATLTEYLEKAEKVRRSVIKVRGNMARSKHTQWWLTQKYPKDEARLVSISSMIDKWSMAHVILVIVVTIAQVTMLKRFFNLTPTTVTLKNRA